jgi:hypothetical protein
MVSSMVGNGGRASVMGESRAVLFKYFGVRASEDVGGDMYCSTPTSIGNV